jgi:hypothetical protein
MYMLKLYENGCGHGHVDGHKPDRDRTCPWKCA